jgi:hypothetical protein
MGPRTRTLQIVVAVALALSIAVPATAAAKTTVQARLTPTGTAKQGAGTFTATGGSGSTVTVRWKLSVSNLSGRIRRASLQTAGPTKISFTLCRSCKAKRKGKIVLLGSMWKRIVDNGGTILIRTRKHPHGELRGRLARV